MNPETPQPASMKERCCLCGGPLIMEVERYIDEGNYCVLCSRECSRLANIAHARGDRSEYYKEESERFQKSLQNKRDYNGVGSIG